MDVHHLPGYPTASSSTIRFTPELPAELWTRIFRFATGGPVHMSAAYVPFADHSGPFIDSNQLRIKAAIILVCRRWRALGLHFFYQEIRIPNRPAIPVDGLLEGLQRVERFETEPNGRHVRRLILSSTRVDYDLAVLKCCPYVRVVIKPASEIGDDSSRIQRFPFPDPSISSFNFLQLIEWSFPNVDHIYSVNEYYTQESLSVLWHILHLAPNLRYFSLTGETPWLLQHHRAIFSDMGKQMQHLRALRTHGLTGGLLEGIAATWILPNLAHLITDSIPLLQTIQAYDIRIIDLLDCLGWPTPFEDVRHVLALHPQLERFSCILESVSMPPIFDVTGIFAPNLQCVRLHKRSSSTLINRHLEWLCGSTLPSLKQVILYGDWKQMQDQALIRHWIPRFAARDCSLREA